MREFLSQHSGATQLRVVLGRVVGSVSRKEIGLPFASEVILDDGEHDFDPFLSPDVLAALRVRLEEHRSAWEASPVSARRWAECTVEEVVDDVPVAPRGRLTVYCPDSVLHFQLQVGEVEQPQVPHQRRRVAFFLRKASGGSASAAIWWRVSLCTQTLDDGVGHWVELEMNPSFLWEQCARWRAGKVHSFSLLAGDLLRNIRALQAAAGASKADTFLSYPGLFEPSVAVREFYEKKATQCKQLPSRELSENIRRHNNLVKVLLIEQSVDTLSAPVRVLDLGCGHGQDLNKYNKQYRPNMGKYVGVDFATTAIAEAKRRFSEISARVEHGERYEAFFYSGDMRSAETYAQLVKDGHDLFDVACTQFSLQYVADSEATVNRLLQRLSKVLRPGARLVGSVPSCDALADLYDSVSCGAAGFKTAGNGLFQVRYDGAWHRDELGEEDFSKRWGLDYEFSLVDAVDKQREYIVPWPAFEKLAAAAGFEVILDAPYSQILEVYSMTSKYYNNVFCRDGRGSILSADEDELFGLYNGFVMQRVSA